MNAHSNSEASPITSHISRCHLFRFNTVHLTTGVQSILCLYRYFTLHYIIKLFIVAKVKNCKVHRYQISQYFFWYISVSIEELYQSFTRDELEKFNQTLYWSVLGVLKSDGKAYNHTVVSQLTRCRSRSVVEDPGQQAITVDKTWI